MPRSVPFILLTIAVIFAPPPASGATELSLEEAMATALDHNHSIAASSAQVAAAQARQDQARGFRFPDVDVMEMFTVTNNPAEVFAFTLNQGRFDMDEFFMSDPNAPDTLDTWMTSVEITQPIYTGGQVSTRIRQSDLMAQASRLDLEHARQTIAFEVVTAYIRALKARERLDVVRRARQTTARHVDLAEKYATQGFIIEAEVLNARVYLAQMDEMVLQAQNDADLAQSALNFAMGTDQSLRYDLQPLPKTPPPSGPMVTWIDRAVGSRLDLQARRRELDAGRLEEKAVNPGWKPEIALKGRYDLYDDQFFGSNGHSGSMMAVAKINLFSGGSDRAESEAARQDALSGEHSVAVFEEGVRLEVRSAFADVRTAVQRHEAASRSVTAAREAHRVREKRFEQGLDKMIDLLDAETALRESELRELVARFDLNQATTRLKFASGTPLINRSETTPQETQR